MYSRMKSFFKGNYRVSAGLTLSFGWSAAWCLSGFSSGFRYKRVQVRKQEGCIRKGIRRKAHVKETCFAVAAPNNQEKPKS